MTKKILFIFVILMLLTTLSNIVLVSANNGDFAYTKVKLLNQDPDPAQPGQYVEIRFKVDKLGGDLLKNITFTLDAPYPFSFDPSDKPVKTLGDMKGYSDEDGYYILYYKLRVDSNALKDIYTIKLNESDNNGALLITRSFDIRVNNDKPDFVLGNLVTSPRKLVSDTDGAQINVELENIGEMDAQNVIMKMDLPDGFTETYGYSNREILGTVASGASKTAHFLIDIDDSVKGGITKAKLTINYKESNSVDDEYKTKIMWLDIPIKRKPLFEINSVTSNPKEIHAGDEVSLKLLVKNVGGDDAKSTSIRVFKESSQPFNFDDKTDYIGELKTNESGEALLKFTVDKDAASKSYLLNIEIRSIDGDDVITQDKTIQVKVANKISNNKNFIIFAIVGLIIILILGSYFFRKKKV